MTTAGYDGDVVWIDPPEFSDGLADVYPRTCFDEDLVRSRYLSAEFRDLVWRTGQSASLLSSSFAGKQDSDFAALSNNGGLKVEFHVPLDGSCVRYHKFLLMAGRSVRDGLRQIEQIQLINGPTSLHGSRMAVSDSQSKQTLKVFKYDEYLDELESVDIETISDSEQMQVDLLLGKNQELHSDSTLETYGDDLVFAQSQPFKLSHLPDNYKLYDRLIIEYPSPPLLYNSINKISKIDDDDLPKIRLHRSFALFGHPSGEPMSACQFSRHLMWLYQMSIDYPLAFYHTENKMTKTNRPLESIEAENEIGQSCSCTLCPYDLHCLTKFRAGETVWISLEYLHNDHILSHSVAECFFTDEIDYWPAEVVSRKTDSDNELTYGLELISFPWYAIEESRRKVRVKNNRVMNYILPFSQYRPPHRVCDSITTTDVKKTFLSTYMRIISESTTFFPCTVDNNLVGQLIFGPEVIHPGDWVVIRDETAQGLHLDRSMRYVMKIAEMLAKKDLLQDTVCVEIMGNVYKLSEEHSISHIMLVDVALGIDDIEGRSYVDHPIPEFPVMVERFNPHLGFSKHICRVFTSHLLDMDLDDYFSGYRDYLKSSWPFSSSLAYMLMLARHRWSLLRLCKSETYSFLKDYKDNVVDKIPILLSVKEEQERQRSGRDTRHRPTNQSQLTDVDDNGEAETNNPPQRTRKRSETSSAKLALIKEARDQAKREQLEIAPNPTKSLAQLQQHQKQLHQSVDLDVIFEDYDDEDDDEEDEHIVVDSPNDDDISPTVNRVPLLPTPPPSEASPAKLADHPVNIEDKNRRMTRAVRRCLDEEEEQENQKAIRRSKRSRSSLPVSPL